MSANARGALFMTLCMAAFAVNDALMKAALAETPLFQAVFLRGVGATALLAAIVWSSGGAATRPSRGDRRLLGLRVVGEVLGTLCFLSAIAAMPLANATAILQSMPLAVALAAAVFLGEPLGWRRAAAIGAGFLGVLLIARPGADGFGAGVVFAVCAVAALTLRDLCTRRISMALPASVAALVTASAITVFAGLGAVFVPWTPLDLRLGALIAGASVFIVAAYYFSVMAMRSGEIGFVAPFRYMILVWALALGWSVFGEVPDALTLLGAAIIVATGVYAFYRERRARGRQNDAAIGRDEKARVLDGGFRR